MANLLSWLTGREDRTEQPSPIQYDDGQPSLRAYNPAPSEQFGQWMSGLLGAGPGASLAKQNFATGIPNLLAASPLGIGLSAADLIHAKNANDPMGAAAAAIGMVPGLKPEVQAVRQGIRAFHGSPHDFDRFDISKIGTGEGAQAYGHGLYFAENEGVARGYREQLASNQIPTEKLAEYYKPGEILRTDYGYDLVKKFDKDSRAVTVRSVDKEGNPTQDLIGLRDRVHTTQPSLETFNSVMRARGIPEHKPGSMYEVNINAKPEQFLDWDRLLRDQPQAVQNLTKDLFAKRFPNADPFSAESVGSAYKRLENFGTGRSVSQEFDEAGIPGIRYLDQGSRNYQNSADVISLRNHYENLQKIHGNNPNADIATAMNGLKAELVAAENPTRNYVLFNDQLVDIMRKYGLAAPAAAGAASYAMQPQDAQAGKAQPAQFQPPVPLSDKITQMIDSLQWGDQWQGRMKLPLQNKVNQMLGESVWPPLR